MRFSVLASGSEGNVTYVETTHARILIDAGLSCREMVNRLEMIGVNPETVQALFITHEHSDHMKGAGPLARLLEIPVYINSPTLRRCFRVLGNLSKPIAIHTGQTITVNDLSVQTFSKCHDAADPMGLVISSDGIRLGLITDLGRSTSLVEERLKGCRALIVEFNHDQKMLEEGPYPWEVKRRIKGPEGHLSNRQAAELLKALAHENLRLVILAHLSATNNSTQRAFREAKVALQKCGLNEIEILISYPDRPVSMVELDRA